MSEARYPFGFIGAGKLSSSVMRGLLLRKLCQPEEIMASEPNNELRATVEKELGITVTAENKVVADNAATIFIGVKPQFVLPVLRDLGSVVNAKLVASFAAGIRIEDMEAVTPARVMRVMTNTPSATGFAATAFAPGMRSTGADIEMIRRVFQAIGVVVQVTDDQIDAVTALAGSGPAFVYTVIEALARGATASGLTEDAALALAAQTARGAAEMLLTSGRSPDELRKMVVTPGGTTAAGLAEIERRSAAQALGAAVEAAAKRGQEMAREYR